MHGLHKVLTTPFPLDYPFALRIGRPIWTRRRQEVLFLSLGCIAARNRKMSSDIALLRPSGLYHPCSP